MALLFTGKFTVSPEIISEHSLGETLLLNVKTLVYIRLNSLAGSLWQLLSQHDDLESVFTSLQKEQNLPAEQLESFFNGCIQNFEHANLISLAPATRSEPWKA